MRHQVDEVKVYSAAPICVYAPAKVLLSPVSSVTTVVCPTRPSSGLGGRGQLRRGAGKVGAAGLARHGRGMVAVIGDHHLFMNMMGGHGFEEGQNSALLVALIEKLAQRTIPKAASSPLLIHAACAHSPLARARGNWFSTPYCAQSLLFGQLLDPASSLLQRTLALIIYNFLSERLNIYLDLTVQLYSVYAMDGSIETSH